MRYHSIARVQAALEAMGFKPKISHEHAFISLLKFDTENGLCVIVLDGAGPDVQEDDLVRALANNGVDLYTFWTHYDMQG